MTVYFCKLQLLIFKLIKNQEMIKGIYNNVEKRPGYFDEELIVPIVCTVAET